MAHEVDVPIPGQYSCVVGIEGSQCIVSFLHSIEIQFKKDRSQFTAFRHASKDRCVGVRCPSVFYREGTILKIGYQKIYQRAREFRFNKFENEPRVTSGIIGSVVCL